ncbi:hypothetical protein Peur_034739 [Populus x canadensis]
MPVLDLGLSVEGSSGISVPFHGNEHLVGARGQILLIISDGVLLSPVASTVGANGYIPHSEGICPLNPHEMVHLMILVCWFLHLNVLEGSVLKMAILFATTICSVELAVLLRHIAGVVVGTLRRILNGACPTSDLINVAKFFWFAEVDALMALYSSANGLVCMLVIFMSVDWFCYAL